MPLIKILSVSYTHLVIRLLLKRYQAMEHDFTGDKIGIDDFAYKKRRITVSPLIFIPNTLHILEHPSQLVSNANEQIKSAQRSVIRL